MPTLRQARGCKGYVWWWCYMTVCIHIQKFQILNQVCYGGLPHFKDLYSTNPCSLQLKSVRILEWDLITLSNFLFQSSSGAQFTDYLHFNCHIYTFKPHLQREMESMFIYNLLWSESDFDFMYWSWSVSTMWLLFCCRCHSNDESLLQVKNISRVVLNPYRLLICRFRLDKWLFFWNISSHDHHNWIDTFGTPWSQPFW